MPTFQPNQTTAPQTFVVTRTAQVTVPLTVTPSSAYVANNSVGGLIRFRNITGPQQSGIVQNVTVLSQSVQTTGYKLYLFNDIPERTTVTDKVTPSLNAVDLPKLLNVITLGSADSTIGKTINVTNGIGVGFIATTQTLYGVLVANSTPTYTAATDVSVTLTVLQD
jgi:hypothetical protein